MTVYAEFEVPGDAMPGSDYLQEYPDVTFQVDPVVPMGYATQYVWVHGLADGTGLERLRADDSIEALTTVEELPDRTLIRIEWDLDGNRFLGIVDEAGGAVVGATGTGGTWTVQVRATDSETLTRIYETCTEEGIAIDLRGIDDSAPRTSEAEFGLSERQRETLLGALEAGYFEVPRRTTIHDIARRNGISDQAASERLRRGLSALVTGTLPAADGDERSDRDGR